MQTKKSKSANLERKRSVFLLTGTMVALAAVLMAFEFTVFKPIPKQGGPLIIFNSIEEDPVKVVIIEKKKVQPPKPKVKKPSDKITITDQPVVDTFILDIIDTTDIVVIDSTWFAKEEVDEAPILIADKMPLFPGGESAMFQFFAKNIVYPEMAVEANVQGKVYVTFVVDKEGKITNVNVLKGLPAGCTEEALRVLNNMPDWEPGWNDGKRVSVQYNLPIHFKLK